MRVASEPEMNERLAKFGRDLVRRHQRAPRHPAGKARWLVVADASARRRPQAVGCNQRDAVFLDLPASGAAHGDGDPVRVRGEVLHPQAGLERDVELRATASASAACRSPR